MILWFWSLQGCKQTVNHWDDCRKGGLQSRTHFVISIHGTTFEVLQNIYEDWTSVASLSSLILFAQIIIRNENPRVALVSRSISPTFSPIFAFSVHPPRVQLHPDQGPLGAAGVRVRVRGAAHSRREHARQGTNLIGLVIRLKFRFLVNRLVWGFSWVINRLTSVNIDNNLTSPNFVFYCIFLTNIFVESSLSNEKLFFEN